MNSNIPLLQYALILAVSYLFGSIPWGLIIGRCKGIDIRKHGSGNIGATNVRRVLGKKLGILCFVLDFLKGLLPVLAVIGLRKSGVLSENAVLAEVLAGFGAFAGHVWTIYLKFKGGKGIATAAGVLAALAPLSLLCSGLVWALVFLVSRYVSLASMAAAALLPVTALVFRLVGVHHLHVSVIVLLFIIAVLAVWRHRSNIKRLLDGTENRFDKRNSYATVSERKDENDGVK